MTSDLSPDNHGWRGKGKFRLARHKGTLVLTFAGLHTRGGRLAKDIGDFFRKEARNLQPDYAPWAVEIWIELHQWQQKIDVDNVAKACLDALTGHIWKDDRQVVSLVVHKVQSDREAVTLRLHQTAEPLGNDSLSTLLDTLDRKDAP